MVEKPTRFSAGRLLYYKKTILNEVLLKIVQTFHGIKFLTSHRYINEKVITKFGGEKWEI